MSVPDRKAWGWCPSVLRPMPLDDGLMVRIRVPGGALSAAQAEGLAELAERFGAGVIELTNRANLQVRGLSEADHAALVPELEALGLAQIDHTPSGRVNITQSPFRGVSAAGIAAELADHLAAAEFGALPQKFGFVVDIGMSRVLADVPGDVRIEAAGAELIVRAEGSAVGCVTGEPVRAALDLARWFVAADCVGADGRGRMAEHAAKVPDTLRGDTQPNDAVRVRTDGPEWLCAPEGVLSPKALRAGLKHHVTKLRVTPFRALYMPELAPGDIQDNKAELAMGRGGVDAV